MSEYEVLSAITLTLGREWEEKMMCGMAQIIIINNNNYVPIPWHFSMAVIHPEIHTEMRVEEVAVQRSLFCLEMIPSARLHVPTRKKSPLSKTYNEADVITRQHRFLCFITKNQLDCIPFRKLSWKSHFAHKNARGIEGAWSKVQWQSRCQKQKLPKYLFNVIIIITDVRSCAGRYNIAFNRHHFRAGLFTASNMEKRGNSCALNPIALMEHFPH